MTFTYGLLFLTLLVGGFAIPAPESELSDFFFHTDSAARVVGGSTAPEGSAPYMVALTDGLLIRSYFCGGSLVSTRSVLTAAHCIANVFSRLTGLSNNLRGIVGTNRHNMGGTTYRFSRNVTHPNYVSSVTKNDLGLLITSTQVVLSPTVSPLPLSFDFIGEDVPVRIIGWGRIVQGGSLSTTLMELFLDTIEGERCVVEAAAAAIAFNRPDAPHVEPHIELCTYHSAGHGTCNGDSGSPLVEVSSGRQVGVVSWGFPCARGAPDMFVRVSAYSQWFAQSIV